MSILAHSFNEENHLYRVEGRYVLSTSDVIDLVGLSDLSQIPMETLRRAIYRGKCLHTAVEKYEQGQDWQDDFPAEFMPYLDGWFAFRDEYAIELVGKHEMRYVYVHEGTEQAIGATIDLRFIYQDWLYIGDLKTIHPVCGKALKAKQLEWRLQTQSYAEVTAMDQAFISSLRALKGIRRCVVHIHPKLQTTSRTVRGDGYALYMFPQDDSLLWDGAIRLAMEKVSIGILPDRRNVDVAGDLRASLEVMA